MNAGHSLIPKWRCQVFLVTMILANLLFSARAQDSKDNEDDKEKFPPWDRAALSVGADLVALNSSVTLGLKNAPGLGVSGENLLGLNSSLLVFAATGFYRVGESKRSQFTVSYSSYRRSSSILLGQDTDVGGIVVPAGSTLDSFLNFAIIRASYTYAIIQDDRVRIGLGLGFYVAPISYGITSVVGGTPQTLTQDKLTLPLPALELDGEIKLLPKLFLMGNLDAMYLKIDGTEGLLISTALGLEYRPWRHFGLGLLFNALAINVQGSSGTSYPGVDFSGKASLQYGGLFMYGKVAF
jgi:hypothetical protein